MRAWARIPFPKMCGRCSEIIAKGDPALVLRSLDPLHPWVKYRCATCAEEPAPELPPLAEVPVPVVRAQEPRIRVPGFERFDYKFAQSGKE